MELPQHLTPAQFRDRVLIDTDHGPRPFGEVMDPWQRADFEALDEGWKRASGLPFFERDGDPSPINRAWIERPRGHAKSTDLALMVAWVLACAKRNVSGVAAAADKEQVGLLRNAILRLTELNPFLAEVLEVQENKVQHKTRRSSNLVIISSDERSSYGLLCDFIIVDEVTHMGKRDRLWNSLFSTAGKRAHCMFVNISNAGFTDSWQWQRREAIREDDEWYFVSLPGACASWLDPRVLAQQKRILPSIAYGRLWENKWGDAAGDAISRNDLLACICRKGPVTSPEEGFAYTAGLDIGIRRDASSLAIVSRHVGHVEYVEKENHRGGTGNSTLDAMLDLGIIEREAEEPEHETIIHPGTDKYRLCDVTIWKPQDSGGQVDLGAVERAIIEATERYGLVEICADPWQAEFLIQRLAKKGIPIRGLNLGSGTQNAMASMLINLFKERAIELFEHADLIADLRGLQIEQRAGGFKLVPKTQTAAEAGDAGTRHGDSSVALAYALTAARRFDGRSAPRVSRPLICWP